MNKMKQNDIMKAIDKLRFHYVTIIDLFGRKERAKKSPADNRWGFFLPNFLNSFVTAWLSSQAINRA